jgi:uncharacterized FAD-dependent dehydrogenase
VKKRVIIIGAGPAGMFCADELAQYGVETYIVEMGRCMEKRKCPQTESCNCDVCDILSGDGGAGGFSDGKKTLSIARGTQGETLFDKEYEELLPFVDSRIVKYGGKGIWYSPVGDESGSKFNAAGFKFSSYPLRHIGSDGVRRMIIGYRDYLKSLGVRFFHGVDVRRIVADKDGAVGVQMADDTPIWMADHVVAATGLQGSPWLTSELRRLGAKFSPGPAGIGMRLETKADVLQPIFDTFYDFKIERGSLRSFCCNSHGSIVNENHNTLGVRNVNGHSYLDPDRRTSSSNFAIMAKVTPAMTEDPQSVVCEIARAVNYMADEHTAVQRAVDFVAGVATHPKDLQNNRVRTNFQSIAGVDIGMAYTLVSGLREQFTDYVEDLDQVAPGVMGDDSLIYAPEVKYYSPRVDVDKNWQSNQIPGLYVVGNASGYIDSFVAAAMSGLVAARGIIGDE